MRRCICKTELIGAVARHPGHGILRSKISEWSMCKSLQYLCLFANFQSLFIGYGPDFLEKTEVEMFENIQLYNLMAREYVFDDRFESFNNTYCLVLFKEFSQTSVIYHSLSCQKFSVRNINCVGSLTYSQVLSQIIFTGVKLMGQFSTRSS